MIPSSPGLIAAWQKLKKECLAPQETRICSGRNENRLSFFSLSQIAARNSGVPAEAVYLVKPVLIAEIPASLTKSGVSKSGSPATRLATSTPVSARAFDLASSARVAEG